MSDAYTRIGFGVLIDVGRSLFDGLYGGVDTVLKRTLRAFHLDKVG